MLKMKSLVVQVHPGIDGFSDRAVTLLRRVLDATVPAEDLRCEQGEEGWLNFDIQSDKLAGVWSAIRADLTKDAPAFAELSQRWIVVAHGQHDWNDYKMLAHFDPSVRLDELPKDS
jgi:hypothetical protein